MASPEDLPTLPRAEAENGSFVSEKAGTISADLERQELLRARMELLQERARLAQASPTEVELACQVLRALCGSAALATPRRGS